jgi:fatty-acid desaturase
MSSTTPVSQSFNMEKSLVTTVSKQDSASDELHTALASDPQRDTDVRANFYVPQDARGLATVTNIRIKDKKLEESTPLASSNMLAGSNLLSSSALKNPVDSTLTGISAFARLGTNWPIAIWIAVVHVLALIAPFYFTWPALAMCGILIFVTASLGVCMGYHRLLTHRSFKTYRPIRWLLAILGGLSGEGSALTWVAQHRRHHVYSDHEGDPHTPKDGSWWSHMFWFLPDFGSKWHHDLLARYAPDIMKDRVMVWIHRMFLPSHFLLGGLLYATGYFCNFWGLGGTSGGLSMLFWGLGVRMVYVLHTTWFVNSVTHMWGYRNYDTSDNSRNLWWVSLATFGEGWHNNHHAYQQVASQGHHWWEIDVTYWVILLMEKAGLAWDIVRLKDVPKPHPQ